MRHWACRFFDHHHPWVAGAQGPHEFDCWGFVRFCQREFYGRDVPLIVIDADDDAAVACGIRQAVHTLLRGGQWRQSATPADGDGVVVRKGQGENHVGLWIDVDGGGLLHCVQEAGVIFSTLNHLRLAGWSAPEFYRYQGSV